MLRRVIGSRVHHIARYVNAVDSGLMFLAGIFVNPQGVQQLLACAAKRHAEHRGQRNSHAGHRLDSVRHD